MTLTSARSEERLTQAHWSTQGSPNPAGVGTARFSCQPVPRPGPRKHHSFSELPAYVNCWAGRQSLECSRTRGSATWHAARVALSPDPPVSYRGDEQPSGCGRPQPPSQRDDRTGCRLREHDDDRDHHQDGRYPHAKTRRPQRQPDQVERLIEQQPPQRHPLRILQGPALMAGEPSAHCICHTCEEWVHSPQSSHPQLEWEPEQWVIGLRSLSEIRVMPS